jgi:hypothetical protein
MREADAKGVSFRARLQEPTQKRMNARKNNRLPLSIAHLVSITPSPAFSSLNIAAEVL